MSLAHISLRCCFAVLVVCGAAGCAHDQLQGRATDTDARTAPEQKKGDTMKSEKSAGLIDDQKAAHAVAVLRVKFLAALGGNKYAWDKVEELDVIKNESHHKFDKVVEIAHYSWSQAFPKGSARSTSSLIAMLVKTGGS